MTFPTIQEIVLNYSLNSDKSLGQNFLYDLDLTAKIVQAAGNITGKTILEVGPGAGSLTRTILNSNIATLTSIELDSRCVKALSYLKNYYQERFNLMPGNALTFKLKEHFEKKIIIIANLPYNISTQLFFKWVDEVEYIEKMVLMFQKEVASRIIAQPGDNNYGKLSVINELFFDSTHYMDLAPELFHPAPKVESSVIVFIPRPGKYQFDYKKINHLLTLSFTQRRKMLRNNLIKTFPDITEVLEQCSINPNSRPEELTAKDYVNIAALLPLNKEPAFY